MKTEEIEFAIKEAERFVDTAKQLLKAKSEVAYTYLDETYFCSAPKESGATRRASMDLTRQLAKMRKP